MSKTAAEWKKEADQLLNSKKYNEAIECYDKAISMGLTSAAIYNDKGVAYKNMGNNKKALECYEKAAQVDPNFIYSQNNMGVALRDLCRPEEALKAFNRALTINPNYTFAYNNKGLALMDLGRKQEAVEAYNKANQLDPNYVFPYNNKGLALKDLGRYEEAIQAYEKASQIDPNYVFPYNNKGIVLYDLKRYDEAIKCYEKAISLSPSYASAYSNMGLIYRDQAKHDKALEYFSKAVELNPNHPLFVCNKASSLLSLGREKEALEAMKRAQVLIQSDELSADITEGNRRYVRETLKTVMEIQEMVDKSENLVKGMDQNNALVKGFVDKIKVIQLKKNKVAADLLRQQSTGDDTKMNKLAQEVEELKAYKEEMRVMQMNFMVDLEKQKQQVQVLNHQVAQIQYEIQDVRIELNNKMDDYVKKLNNELNKRDVSVDDQKKIKDYFKAFIETFSSTYVTSQVVDSGQVQLDAGDTATSILSGLASFLPFFGDAASSGISSIGEFLKSKEMKKNARVIKGLASDPSELSQTVGKAGYDIVLDPQQFKKILQITDRDLQEASTNLFSKIKQFVDKLQEDLDVYLYSNLYKTAAARLGHMDANTLIEEWLKGTVPPYSISEKFVQIIVHPEEIQSPETGVGKVVKEVPSTSRGACCNIF